MNRQAEQQRVARNGRVAMSEACQFNKEIIRGVISTKKDRQAEQQQVARSVDKIHAGRFAKARVSEWVKIYFYTQ